MGSRLKLVRPRVDSLTCTHLRLQGQVRRPTMSQEPYRPRGFGRCTQRRRGRMRLLGWQCMHVSSRQDKPSVRRPEIEWSDPGGATNTSRGLTHSLEAPRRGCREGYPNPTSMSDMWITHRPRSRTACVLLRRMSPHLRAPHMRPPYAGMQTVCDSHRVQLDRHGELRPDTWSKEWVCVVCGAGVPKGSGRRKHCSRAVSKPTLDTTGVAQRRRNVGYAGRTSPYSGAPGRGFSAPTLSGAAPAVENPPKRADI
ncbi:hypothetical protein SAMN04488548_10215 [Gordonia westfalica]|uniref:Uncharacterized protein n=1 Tax=Gordonia westfalica TaxID=158898 RepID=A0A1H2DLH7_9ACTN|nr:hypothetical protein SAMN04488548_10215 [Gordonia westfalica]